MQLTELSNIFSVNYGTDLELNKLNIKSNGIRFVSRTRKNNGVSAYVEEIKEITPNPSNSISVALGSSSVLFAFLQEKPYYSGRDIAYLIPFNPLTKNEMLFYCMCIKANRFRYNYGRQANKTIKTLLIPKKSEIPHWVNKVKIQDLNHLDRPCIDYLYDNQKQKKFFDFLDIFEFIQEEQHKDSISVNLISALTENNGIKECINTDTYITGNKITITSNGIYTGTAFYQRDAFVTQDSIALKLKGKELNKYIAMYLICILNAEKFRFNYGRKSGKLKLAKLKLLLPTTENKNPDYDFMENYIKSLPYSKSI